MSEEKVCKKCGVSKPVSDFAIQKAEKDGLNRYCRPCRRTYQADRRKKREFPAQPTSKVCRKCQVELPAAAFSPEKLTGDGLRSDCKTCHNAWQRAQIAQSPEKREKQRLRCRRDLEALRQQKEALIAEGLLVRPRRGPRPRPQVSES